MFNGSVVYRRQRKQNSSATWLMVISATSTVDKITITNVVPSRNFSSRWVSLVWHSFNSSRHFASCWLDSNWPATSSDYNEQSAARHRAPAYVITHHSHYISFTKSVHILRCITILQQSLKTKKLSCRIETARCSVSLSHCQVTRGHSKWHPWVGRV